MAPYIFIGQSSTFFYFFLIIVLFPLNNFFEKFCFDLFVYRSKYFGILTDDLKQTFSSDSISSIFKDNSLKV